MLRSACLCIALLLAPDAAQYRLLSFASIIKAVGSNPEGMPPEVLSQRIASYTYFTSDDLGLGVAARFVTDPEGAILMGWRYTKELWRYAWIEEPSLGRLEAIRPAGPLFIIDTRHPDGTGTTGVLRPDLTLLATVPGIFSAFRHDPKTDTVTLELRAGTTMTTMRCTGISGAQSKCS